MLRNPLWLVTQGASTGHTQSGRSSYWLVSLGTHAFSRPLTRLSNARLSTAFHPVPHSPASLADSPHWWISGAGMAAVRVRAHSRAILP